MANNASNFTYAKKAPKGKTKKIISKADFPINLSDEELIRVIRSQKSQHARDVLASRYMCVRLALQSRMFPSARKYLNEWDLNEIYFISYLKAEANYSEKRNSRFMTYFTEIYRNELSSALKEAAIEKEYLSIISLDSNPLREPSRVMLHEVVATTSAFDDPVSGLEFDDVIALLQQASHIISKNASKLAILMLEGYTIAESCKKLKISLSSGKLLLRRMREFLIKKELGHPDGSASEEE